MSPTRTLEFHATIHRARAALTLMRSAWYSHRPIHYGRFPLGKASTDLKRTQTTTISMFSHGSTPSTPGVSSTKRPRDDEHGNLSTLHDVNTPFTESPRSQHTAKKVRPAEKAGVEVSRPATPTTPPTPTPSRANRPPFTLDASMLQTPAQDEQPADPRLSLINDLLQRALLLAVEAGPLTPSSEKFSRTRQLLRTLDSYFDIAGSTHTVPPCRPTSITAAATTSSTRASRLGTYASAARKVATTLSHGSAVHSQSQQPQRSLNRKVNTGRLQRRHSDKVRSSRVIIRFISSRPSLPEDPSRLYDILSPVLSMFSIPIHAVSYTHSQNIAIHTPSPAVAERLRQHGVEVYDCISEAVDWEGQIALDSGTGWHSVVVHGVPIRHVIAGQRGMVDVENYVDQFINCLVKGGNEVANLAARCVRIVPLTKLEELGDLTLEDTRRISVRMDLTEEGIATRFLQKGVFIGGAYCRVSQYKARHKASST